MSQSEIEQPVESPESASPEVENENVASAEAGENTSAEAAPEATEEVQPEVPAESAVDGEAADNPEGEVIAVSLSADDILGDETSEPTDAPVPVADAQLLAVLEAIIYVTDEPLTLDQISEATEQPRERIAQLLEQLCTEYDRPERGLSIREIAGGFRMTTKAEHHEAVRRFVKNLNPPMKLSLPALETLAVIAYKQPITAPEIMDIHGVQGAGVLKTLLDRKLIAAAGRKQVVGKPILYKTTKEFLVQFGLKNLQELPTMKEFQEIGSLAGGEPEGPVQANLIEMPVHADLDGTEDAEAETTETEARSEVAETSEAENGGTEASEAGTASDAAETSEAPEVPNAAAEAAPPETEPEAPSAASATPEAAVTHAEAEQQ